MIKTDDMEKMYTASLAAKTYDPALMQKMIQYLYDNALQTNLWVIPRGYLVQPYIHDTGFMSQQSWPIWIPENAWLSK